MSKLTRTAKKTYAGLVFGNLLIIFAIMLLGQYFYYVNLKPIVPANTVHSLVKVVHVLKNRPEMNWPRIIQRQNVPWTKMTLSETALYPDNTLLNLQQHIIMDLLKQDKKFEASVFIKEGTWLNISMLPPLPNLFGLYLTLITLFLILLIVLCLLSYWAVKTLNQPIETLIQSLQYSESQESWLPIPVTGNSDQKIIFEKINYLQEKVNKLLNNRTRVVTAISHDLRTPLTRLKLRAEYFADNPVFEKFMEDINEMEVMIRETLDYFRDVNSEEKMQRFDLIAMLSSITDDAVELDFEVTFESDLDKLIFVGCVSLLKRAFTNLINNAIYYGKSAAIHLQQKPQQIEISITDKGPGIQLSDQEQVFLPFYRGESSRSRATGGAGLGLTIAREIIQKHGGNITLTNSMQGGLQVLVILPYKVL